MNTPRSVLKLLPEKLPNLEEVTLFVDNDVRRNDVIDFIRSCKQLKKLHLTYTKNELSQNFEHEIDEKFDVGIVWDANAQKGTITIELKYDN